MGRSRATTAHLMAISEICDVNFQSSNQQELQPLGHFKHSGRRSHERERITTEMGIGTRSTYDWAAKSFWALSSRLLGAALSSIIAVVLARVMAKDDVGRFFWVLSVCWGGAAITQWGGTMLAVKWIASARAQNDAAATVSAAWSLVAFTFIHVCLLAAFALLFSSLSGSAPIFGLWIFSLAFQILVPELIRGLDDIKWASLLSGPLPQGLALLLLVGFWLWWGRLTFEQGALGVIGAGLISSIVGLAILRSQIAGPWRLRAYPRFFADGAPIALSILSAYVFVQADLWLCGTLLGKEQAAIYGIAQRLVAFVSMPLMLLGAVLTPTMAELLAKGERKTLQNIVRRGTMIAGTFAVAILLAGAVVGRPAIKLLLGDAYINSYALFLILGAGQAFHASAGPNGYILIMAGEQRVVLSSTIVGTLLLVIGGWFAALRWGATGVALTSATCLAIQTVWMWLAVHLRLGLATHGISILSGAAPRISMNIVPSPSSFSRSLS